MNGSSFVVDTNIVLYLFNGDETVASLLDGRNIYISFITELELLGFHGITEEERAVAKDFIGDSIVIDLNEQIKRIAIDLRVKYMLKLPDAIIAASALYLNLPLISADKVFEKISELQFLKYEIE
ncbi:MAG: type II toxin-antitoxin system VapC family toxin [Saprospirales bacterium]|nr:type II toxin-antitoxin system VapC family toxin [Saprospirales bacterium]